MKTKRDYEDNTKYMANLTKTTLDFDDGSQQVFEVAPVITGTSPTVEVTLDIDPNTTTATVVSTVNK